MIYVNIQTSSFKLLLLKVSNVKEIDRYIDLTNKVKTNTNRKISNKGQTKVKIHIVIYVLQ